MDADAGKDINKTATPTKSKNRWIFLVSEYQKRHPIKLFFWFKTLINFQSSNMTQI
jgi:hypothetical protein